MKRHSLFTTSLGLTAACFAIHANADANIGFYLGTPAPVYAPPPPPLYVAPPVVYGPPPMAREYERPDWERERDWRERRRHDDHHEEHGRRRREGD